VKKPQKEFFEQILKELKVKTPREVVYFDDSAENIEVANSLGIQGVVYRTKEDFLNAMQ
jgi:HAD superfamily hydrolase (TIGR01509 family)